MQQDQAQAEQTRLVVADGYEILSCIGTGANGSVYKAQEKLSGLVSAIKVLNEQKDQGDVKRFQREAQLIAKLSHPNIVSMRSFGIQNAAPYLVMEYVDGPSLAGLLKAEGKLSPERTCDLIIQIADALQHAHDMQIFHRDIKPSNIMLCIQNGREVAKLADFGIAKIKAPETRETLTQTGVVLGTPLYMSPEQSMGIEADARSDIYALGCVMYECLSGRTPIEGENFLDVVYKRLNRDVPTFAELGLKVPASLSNIILRCLAREPNERYQSAGEVAQDLRAALAGGVVALPRRAKVKRNGGTALSAPTYIGVGVLMAFVAMQMIGARQTPKVMPSGRAIGTYTAAPAAAVYPRVNVRNPDCKQLQLVVHIQGGKLGKQVSADAIYSAQSLTAERYRKAIADPGFVLLMSEWKDWYGNIFDAVNPPPSGRGPTIPPSFFGWFEVTVPKNGGCIVSENAQIPDDAAATYSKEIKTILQAIPADQLKMPQPLEQAKFRIEVNGRDGRFDMRLNDGRLFADPQ